MKEVISFKRLLVVLEIKLLNSQFIFLAKNG